jgi:hypothetical protein
MTRPLDAKLVEARMRDLAQTSVNQTVSLFKGGIFALAAVLLIEILGQPEGQWLRLALWLSSFMLALVSYNAYLNTSILDFRESVSGVVAIIVQMMIELMLFAAIAPRYSEQAWRFWVFIYAAFMFTTAIRMLYFGMNRGLEVGADLKPMFDTVEKGRRRNSWRLIATSVGALVFGIGVGFLPPQSPWPGGLTIAFSLFACLQSVNGLVGMHRQRLLIERMLEDVLAKAAV